MNYDLPFAKEFIFAQELIQQAGELILTYFDHNPKITKIKSGHSIVTEADEASEALIRKALTSSFPNYGFIGEETPEDNKEISWIVDPIDGTSAFARGIPEFGIAIALKQDDQTMFSVQYLPVLRDLFTAYHGQGAYRNGSKVSVSLISSLTDGLASFDASNIRNGDYSKPVEKLLKAYRFRVGHSSVVESIYLATGKIELLAKFNQAIWDAAPACLLMQEAGAVVTDENGGPFTFTFSKQAKQSYLAINASLSKREMFSLYHNE
jgi:myo-inositol-1(or 4)-monophosphatase